jgi:hypothetical protein
MTSDKNATVNSPVNILNRLLCELLPGNYNTYGQSFHWKVSRDFFDFDFSNLENIAEEFSHEYESVVSQVQGVWGQPDFRGNFEVPGYPEWYWISAIDCCYWTKEEGVAYVSFHREDRELPYEITLGAIVEEAIEEISE